MKRSLLLLCSVCVVMASAAFAENVDDIITMTERGVNEDVILATIGKSAGGYTISAADIVKLKNAKVSDKVVVAMLKHAKTADAADKPVAPPIAPPEVAAPAPAPVQPEAPAVAAGDGTLSIENLDDKTWSYKYEPDAQTLWISPAARDGRGNVDAHGGVNLRMKSGTYKIRYNGMNDGPSVTVRAGEKSLVMVSRVTTAELDALYASVFEKGARKSTGRLAILSEGAPQSRANNAPPPAPQVVDRERVVEVPQTTIIYDTPVYGSPYYYAPGYYGGYYGPGYGYGYGSAFSFGFGYSNFHHGHGFSVGGGFRH